MTVIIDASIAVKWLLDEPKSDVARKIASSGEVLVAPELILAEVGSALWRKYAQGIIPSRQATAALERLPDAFNKLVPPAQLRMRALELAIELQHPIYDCFYLALAERERAPLITADERLIRTARQAKDVEVRPL